MKQIDITKDTFGERIEKSPPFAKDVVIVFSDDVSLATMKLFKKESGKTNRWMDPMLKEMVVDWNLFEKGKKLPFSVEGLNKINSIKLRDWIIATLQEVVVGTLTGIKKK